MIRGGNPMNPKFKSWAGRIIKAALIAMFVFVFAYTLPFDLALLAAIDMATYADALIGVYVVARITRLRPMIFYFELRAALMTRRLGKRARRDVGSVAKKNEGANDDHPAVAIAA
jgi:hypothetical protein